ncbi:hypothetical protein ACVWU4_001040 [Campylobacter coli]
MSIFKKKLYNMLTDKRIINFNKNNKILTKHIAMQVAKSVLTDNSKKDITNSNKFIKTYYREIIEVIEDIIEEFNGKYRISLKTLKAAILLAI